MNCKNCGQPLVDGSTFCGACGTRVETEPELLSQAPDLGEAPEITTPSQGNNESVVPEPEQTYVPPTQQPEQVYTPPVIPDAPKSSPKWVKPVATIAIIALILGGGFLLFKDSVAAFFVRMMPADTQLQYTYARAVGNITDTVSESYGRVYKSYTDETKVKGNMDIEVSEDAISMMLGEDIGVGKASVDYTCEMESTSLMSIDMDLKLDKEKIATIEMGYDLEEGIMTVDLPGLSDGAVEIATGAGYSGGQSIAGLATSPLMQNAMKELLPKEKLVKKIVPKLAEVAFKQITEVDKFKEEYTANGVSQKATCLSATITEETLANMAIAVLEELREDKDIKKYMNDLADGLEKVGDEMGMSDIPDADELYDQYTEAIDQAIEEIEDSNVDSREPLVVIDTYVDSKFNIVAIAVVPNGDVGGLFIAKAKDGKDVGYEAYFDTGYDEVFRIEGSGKQSGDKYTGDIVLYADGSAQLRIDCTKLDLDELKSGFLNGTVEISLDGDLERELLDEIGNIGSPSIIIESKSSAKKNDTTITLNIRGTEFITIHTENKISHSASVKLPKNTEDDIESWGESVDLDKLCDRLEDAGLNEELVDQMRNVF